MALRIEADEGARGRHDRLGRKEESSKEGLHEELRKDEYSSGQDERGRMIGSAEIKEGMMDEMGWWE